MASSKTTPLNPEFNTKISKLCIRCISLLVGLLLMVCDSSNMALAQSGGRMGGSFFGSKSPSSRDSYVSSSPSPSPSRDSYVSPSSRRYHSSPVSYSGPFSPCSYPSDNTRVCPKPVSSTPKGSRNVSREGVPLSSSGYRGGLITLCATTGFLLSCFLLVRRLQSRISVLKIQVALSGTAKSFQRDLNKIAEAADTSTPKGVHYVLTETILAILRHRSDCISAYSLVDVKWSEEEGEKGYNQLLIEERGKFVEETLVNVNNIKKRSTSRGISNRYTMVQGEGLNKEYIVVTLLVAVKGKYKLPTFNSMRSFNDALPKLASIPSRRTMAVEVLWTPQKENDVLSERKLIKDYPCLWPL